MNILSWVLLGCIIGMVTHMSSASKKKDLQKSILIGVCGAFVGGIIGQYLTTQTSSRFSISAFVFAVGSALILLLVSKLSRTI